MTPTGYIIAAVVVLLIIVAIVRKNTNKSEDETTAAPAAPAAAPAAPVAAPAAVKGELAPGSAGEVFLCCVPEREAAIIMAIVADKMGKPLNELRFKSIKEVRK